MVLPEMATFINAAVWLNVYLSVFAFDRIVDSMKKEWLALGLLLILAGFVLLFFSNTSVYQDSYVSRASLNNSVNYSEGLPTGVSLTAYFNASQRFFFNFSKGRFWGVAYDQQHGLEPINTEFAPGTAIEPYKTVEFYLYTPSGDVVVSEVYLVGGSEIFAVAYLNQSADFVPLPGGNLTFANVGMEGSTERSGNYTVKAIDIEPYIMKSATEMYNMSGDPPLQMNLWNVETVVTRPYFASSVSAGGALLLVGAVSSVWAGRPKKRRRAHN
ncbi:MAG: hypothetical protein ABR962_08030 [Candidatus Bathyarchaeia archaeon]|jgi:hypothetical protein